MTRPTRTRDIRKARHDKELFRWFGHGTELPDGDEPRDEEAEPLSGSGEKTLRPDEQDRIQGTPWNN